MISEIEIAVLSDNQASEPLKSEYEGTRLEDMSNLKL